MVKARPRLKRPPISSTLTCKRPGVEVLYDDRDESPGVKFNDADLIGLPLRVTVSERALAQGGVEMKLRNKSEKIIVPLAEMLAELRAALAALEADISARVTGWITMAKG